MKNNLSHRIRNKILNKIQNKYKNQTKFKYKKKNRKIFNQKKSNWRNKNNKWTIVKIFLKRINLKRRVNQSMRPKLLRLYALYVSNKFKVTTIMQEQITILISVYTINFLIYLKNLIVSLGEKRLRSIINLNK